MLEDELKRDDIEKIYDHLVDITAVNIFSLSKNTDKIYLSCFNFKEVISLYFLQIAMYVSAMTHKKVAVQCSLWQFIWFKITHLRSGRDVVRYKEASDEINMNEVVKFMAEANDLTPEIFYDIYNLYYKKG